MFSTQEIQQIVQVMRPVMYQAGYIALQHFKRVKVERKADHSYVTAADRDVERFIRQAIHHHYPHHGFIGEETGRQVLDDVEYVWAVDPIDGTAPFIFDLPVWAISVGLIHRTRGMVGMVYLPALNDLYWAMDGEPAYLNDRPIQVSAPVELNHHGTIIIPSTILRPYTIRYRGRALAFGSAAASLCFVARGKVHGGLQEPIRLYDIAGGAVILKAAGGVMRYFSGQDVDLWALVDGRRTPEPYFSGHPKNVEQLLSLFDYHKELAEE